MSIFIRDSESESNSGLLLHSESSLCEVSTDFKEVGGHDGYLKGKVLCSSHSTPTGGDVSAGC